MKSSTKRRKAAKEKARGANKPVKKRKPSCGCEYCDYLLPFFPGASQQAVHETHNRTDGKPKPKPVFIGTLEPEDRSGSSLQRVRIVPWTNYFRVKLDGTSPLQVYRWAETLRDMHEEDGEFLNVSGILSYASFHLTLPSQKDRELVMATIKTLYAFEYEKELRAAVAWERTVLNRPSEAREGQGSGFPKPGNGTHRVEVKNSVPGVEVRSTEGKGGGRRFWIFGHPVTAVLRWMGANAWTLEDCKAAFEKLGISNVNTTTIYCQLIAGRKGPPDYGGRGDPAALTPQQGEALEQLIDNVPAPKPKKARPKLDMKEYLERYGKGKDPTKPSKKKGKVKRGKAKAKVVLRGRRPHQKVR